MKFFPGLLAVAVIVAAFSAGAFAQDARDKMAAPVASPAAVAATPAASVPAVREHEHEHEREGLQQMQADIADIKTELAVIHQMLTDMQAQQRPTVHSVADVPGK